MVVFPGGIPFPPGGGKCSTFSASLRTPPCVNITQGGATIGRCLQSMLVSVRRRTIAFHDFQRHYDAQQRTTQRSTSVWLIHRLGRVTFFGDKKRRKKQYIACYRV